MSSLTQFTKITRRDDLCPSDIRPITRGPYTRKA
jgi:hypothetical protein